MAKGQKKSHREAKKPKKKAAEKSSSVAGTVPLTDKSFGASYRERYDKMRSK